MLAFERGWICDSLECGRRFMSTLEPRIWQLDASLLEHSFGIGEGGGGGIG